MNFLELDKTSEYFRICPYCKVEFMANHMSREYCSEKCGDLYNNKLKRLRKKKYNSQSALNNDYPLNQKLKLGSDFNSKLQLNISILNSICNPCINETLRSFNFLHSLGFDFNVFESKAKLDEIRSAIIVGPYILKRQEFETIKIEHINPKTI